MGPTNKTPRPGHTLMTPQGPDSAPEIHSPPGALERCLASTSTAMRRVLERALTDHEVSIEDALILDQARGLDLHALWLVADEMRSRQVGEQVTYVVNRNINFTNVCVKSCHFCAFSRGHRGEESYFLELPEILHRAREAWEFGATEVCLQAGLAPRIAGDDYAHLLRSIKAEVPRLHLHAYSPEEIHFGRQRAGRSVTDYLRELKDAGLGSMPGTSAEILDDDLRERISPGRITTAEWTEVITSAHELGIPTSSTMMFGHVETPIQRMRHMAYLRGIQKATGGFTEFVPLSFVHQDAPLFVKSKIPGVRPGPDGDEVMRLYAIARLMLGPTFRNIQVSWVKEGARFAQWILHGGANDLGGTLINESISTAAGSPHGERMTPAALRALTRGAGRLPAERSTTYKIFREFGRDPATDGIDPLDSIDGAEERFGSYRALTQNPQHQYRGAPSPPVTSEALPSAPSRAGTDRR